MADVRYCIEYAKTGRSGCKKCKQQIEKGVARIGKVAPNPFSDDGGDMKVWYHVKCMFETFKVSLLRWHAFDMLTIPHSYACNLSSNLSPDIINPFMHVHNLQHTYNAH